jgi:hypothetical protein
MTQGEIMSKINDLQNFNNEFCNGVYKVPEIRILVHGDNIKKSKNSINEDSKFLNHILLKILDLPVEMVNKLCCQVWVWNIL